MTNEQAAQVKAQIISAFAELPVEEAYALGKELIAKYKQVAVTASSAPDCPYKVGDRVRVLMDAKSVSKKWLGQVLVVTNVGDKKLYLDNPEAPGVKNKSVWPLFSEVEFAEFPQAVEV